MSGLVYLPEQHEYWYDNRQIPGVTRVLADLGYYGNGKQFFTERSREVGTAVHKACMLIDQVCPHARTLAEVLERINLGEALHRYVEGYLLFKRDTGFTSQEWEKPLWDSRIRVAGTIDTWGYIPTGNRVLVDLKSWRSQGAKPKLSAEIQVNAYAGMLGQVSLDVAYLWVLKLPGDGKYRLYEAKPNRYLVEAVATVWHSLYQGGLIKLRSDPEDDYIITGENE